MITHRGLAYLVIHDDNIGESVPHLEMAVTTYAKRIVKHWRGKRFVIRIDVISLKAYSKENEE